jgi:hypothetical protein
MNIKGIHEGTQMIFERLGNIVVKRYKLILVLWVIVFLVCTPLIMNASQVVTYQQQTLSAGQTDSDKASALLNEQFSTSTSNSSMIIILNTDNVSSPEVRDFILALEHQVTSDANIQYFESNTPGAFPNDVISVYTVQQYILIQAVPGINTGMYQTAGFVKLVWGIPALYLQLYLKSFGINRRATAKMNTMIQEMGGGDAQTTKMLS